jgi:tripartite-type tricarboxylate transporter receptor subunit TctC
MMMRRMILLMDVVFSIVLSFMFLVNFAWAAYPDRKIRFIIQFEPGGMSDATARAVVRYANPHLGERIYVENIPGGGSAIGSWECLNAPPDGYTLALLVTSTIVGPYVNKKAPSYDLFDPVCILALDPLTVSVKTDSRFKTAADLISYAKSHPGDVTLGTAGFGTIHHIGVEAFARATGAKFTQVPFKGSGPSVVAATGGHVDGAMASCFSVRPYVEGKKLQVLVVLDTKRSPLYPEVPTARELGYDAVAVTFQGIGVRKGIPEEVKAVLVEAFRKATEDEGYKKLMDQMGLERLYLSPKEAVPWLKSQHDFIKDLATKLGLKPE